MKSSSVEVGSSGRGVDDGDLGGGALKDELLAELLSE